jgi:hypothetical protein
MAERKFFSFQTFATGLVSTFLVTSLLVGSFETAGAIFLCPLTAIVWIPAAFILGFIVSMLVDMFSGRETRKASEIPERTKKEVLKGVAAARTVSSRSAALKDYLQQATAKEFDRGIMVSSLIKNGWSESEIHDALQEVSPVG